MKKKEFQALVAEDVKKVEKKTKIYEAFDNLYEFAKMWESTFLNINSQIDELAEVLDYFHMAEDIDFSDYDEHTWKNWLKLTWNIKCVFNINDSFSYKTEDFWKRLDDFADKVFLREFNKVGTCTKEENKTK